MDYEKKYKDALAHAREIHRNEEDKRMDMEWLFPELKESDDERIRKALIKAVSRNSRGSKLSGSDVTREEALVWLEKQGDTNESINRNEFTQGVLRGAAINLITWIDYNAAEDNTCLSNMECKDIEDALVSGDWDKIYGYIKKKLEKKSEKKSKWSEEDEKMVLSIEQVVNCASLLNIVPEKIDKIRTWLKSLKKRIEE